MWSCGHSCHQRLPTVDESVFLTKFYKKIKILLLKISNIKTILYLLGNEQKILLN
jgi:hypothetical protein